MISSWKLCNYFIAKGVSSPKFLLLRIPWAWIEMLKCQGHAGNISDQISKRTVDIAWKAVSSNSGCCTRVFLFRWLFLATVGVPMARRGVSTSTSSSNWSLLSSELRAGRRRLLGEQWRIRALWLLHSRSGLDPTVRCGSPRLDVVWRCNHFQQPVMPPGIPLLFTCISGRACGPSVHGPPNLPRSVRCLTISRAW